MVGVLAEVDSVEVVGISMAMMGDLVDVAEDLEKDSTKDREVRQEEVEDTEEGVIRAARLHSRCLVENVILVVDAQTIEDEALLPDRRLAFIRAAVVVVVAVLAAVVAAVLVVLALVRALAQLVPVVVARVAVAGASHTLTGTSLPVTRVVSKLVSLPVVPLVGLLQHPVLPVGATMPQVVGTTPLQQAVATVC